MTGIQWTEATWNPTTGCDQVSPGCDNCYALTMASRLKAMGQDKYQVNGDPRTSGPGFGITEHWRSLDEPMRWRKPKRVFVNSMSDVLHAGVSDEFVARTWATMAMASQRTYQVLTKRHGRMRSLLSGAGFEESVRLKVEHYDEVYSRRIANWPLPNVWLGTSVEDQQRARLRIPALTETLAAVRFLSLEPLLSAVDLVPFDLSRIDWVIVGGESGKGARPLDTAWVHDVIDQCRDQGVAVFVKQLGSVWARDTSRGSEIVARHDPKGGDPAAWPRELNVRQYPVSTSGVVTS